MGGLRDSDPVYRLVQSGGARPESRERRLNERNALTVDPRDRPRDESGAGIESADKTVDADERSSYRDAERLPEGAKPVAKLGLNRGRLIGATVEGRFEMVLNSTLERAVGMSVPKHERQRKLFEDAYKDKNIAGYHRDAVFTNSGEPDSPVAIVVRDVLRSARGVANELQSLLDCGVNASLRKLYPFLDIDSDRENLNTLRARADAAKAADDGELHGVLNRAAFKCEAIIERKTAERMRFSRNIAAMAESVERAMLEYGAGEEFTRPVAPADETPEETESDPSQAEQSARAESGASRAAGTFAEPEF
jgi:hypothetical protein